MYTESQLKKEDIVKPVKVMEIGSEGGDITLYGWKTRQGNWRFQRGTDESSMKSMLSENDAAGMQFTSRSQAITGWEGALKLLSQYPWQQLYPLYVHPEFVDLVWNEIEVLGEECYSRWEWADVCGKKQSEWGDNSGG